VAIFSIAAALSRALQSARSVAGGAEAVKAALGEVEFDSASEAEAARAALEDPTTPLEATHGLRVRIVEVVETKEY
jgi:hypothetical protein